MTSTASEATASGPQTARLDRSIGVLTASGALLVVAYGVATARIPLAEYFPERGVSIDFVEMLGPDWSRIVVEYVSFTLVTFALYIVALYAVWRRRGVVHPLLLFGFPALFAVALIAMYPPTAVDMFHYQASSRLLWVHGENPLTTAPAEFPYPIGFSWGDQPSPYGPLWSVLTGPLALIPGDNFTLGLYGFKLLSAASLVGCAWLIWRIVSRLRPGQESLAVVLFAWNPFVLMRVVGNGHNDLVMMFFVLLALERAQRDDWTLAFQALALSCLVKFASLLLGPPLLLYAWFHIEGDLRTRAAVTGRALGLSALVVVLVFAPFWEGLSTLDTVRAEADKMISSTPLLLGLWASGPPVDPEVHGRWTDILRVVFVALAAPIVWQARRSFEHLLLASFTILFLYLVIATGWFRPWYMLWPVALAAFFPRSWLAVCLLAITFSNSFFDLMEQARPHWPALYDDTDATAIRVLVGIAIPACLWLVGILYHRSWLLGIVPSRNREPEPA